MNKISYTKYNDVDYNNVCLCMSFFNPVGYTNITKNIRVVIDEIKKTDIPLYIIELLYPNQSQSIPEANVVVKSNSIFFSKENLWNILEKYIPDKYEKLIYIDSDILCTDPDWVNKTANKLDTYKVVHATDFMYKDIYKDNIHEQICHKIEPFSPFRHKSSMNYTFRPSIVKQFKKQETLNPTIFHPGFNISIDRIFFHKIGGIFEYTPISIGDGLFWMSFIENYRTYSGGFFVAPNFRLYRDMYLDYKKNVLNCCNPMEDIDYLEDNYSLHLYHGDIKNRYYGRQHLFIPGPVKLYKNKYGVIEMSITHPIIKDFKEYFEARNEDEPILDKTDQ